MKRGPETQAVRAVGPLRRGLMAVLLVLGAWGCALVAGVDFDAARIAQEPMSEPEPDAGSTASVPAGPRCGANEKVCDGTCVSTELAAYGCAGSSCEPCSLDLTNGSRCVSGTCTPNGCLVGFEDCDGNPANGCEADLSSPEHCGACSIKCGPGTLCAPTGCVTSCPAPLLPCAGSCIDPLTSTAHCGGCGQSCPGAENADPTCTGGVCAITCRAGFADCANTPAKTCTALPKWYADGDGDGFGTDVFVTGCAKPVGHAAVGGDCNDTNGAIHPDAGASDVPFDGSVGPSFDYDCSGAEEEEVVLPHFTVCTAPCTSAKSGYLPVTPTRTGTGVNAFCGSRTRRECIPIPRTSACQTPQTTATVPIRCR